MDYTSRIVDGTLAARLRSSSAVLVEGPRGCGKTETARRQANSEALFDVDANLRSLAELSPEAALGGSEPRLLDEWQHVPSLWNHVRRACDEAARPGRFILTGSALPVDDAIRHTGAGRVSRLRMRPMSLAETGHSNGRVSLAGLLASSDVACQAKEASLWEVTEAICRGGWPGILGAALGDAQQFTRDYVENVCRAEVADTGSTGRARRDPVRMRRMLRSLARNVATEATHATFGADIGGEHSLHRDTVRSYLDALEGVFVSEDQPAWSVRLRSRSRLRRSPKRHLVDPSLAVAALRTGPDRLLRDLSLLGLLFESLAVRDLRVYADANDADVFHYRDNTGLEVDAVVETWGGDWLACEVKLGGADAVEAAARSLLKLRSRVDPDAAGPPTKLAVVTAVGSYAYDRPDGVAVVPITALGP